MNDNHHPLMPHWAQIFDGQDQDSLIAALSILSGLIDSPRVFENCAVAIRRRAVKDNAMPRAEMRVAILCEVATKHGVTINELRGRSKEMHIASARHEAAYRLREEMGLSFPRIGVLLGHRDHTTILNSWRRHDGYLRDAPYIKGGHA